MRLKIFFLSLGLLSMVSIAHAAGTDLSINSNGISFSAKTFIVGDKIRIYARVENIGTTDVLGYVTFYQGSIPIGDPQVVSSPNNGTPEDVFVDFIVPSSSFNLRAVISGTDPQDINLDNNVVVTGMFTPIFDDDRDEIENSKDNCVSVANANQLDTDKDGKGDACDDDRDNDGITNDVESELGTNPLVQDTDGDGVIDSKDAYPLDPKRSVLEKPTPVVTPPATKTNTTAPTDQTSNTTTVPSTQTTQPKQTASDSNSQLPLGRSPTGEPTSNSNLSFTQKKSDWNSFDFRVENPIANTSYTWEFGDGSRSSKTEVKHVFGTAGSYGVTLKATDKNGATISASKQITVSYFSLKNFSVQIVIGGLLIFLLGGIIIYFYLRSLEKRKRKIKASEGQRISVTEEEE